MLDDMEKALQFPARFIDITFQSANTTSITTKDGIAKDIVTGEVSGFGVRVLDKVWGFASSNDQKDIIDATERACRAAGRGEEEISFFPREGVEDMVKARSKISPLDVPLEEKIDLGRRAFQSIKEEGFVSSSFTYVDTNSEGMYMSSEGTKIERDVTRVAFFGSVFARKNGVIQFGNERAGATAGFEFLKDPESIARKAGEKASRLLEAEAAPSGTFTVVLDPQLTGVLIHEALGHAVEADHVLQGDSILEGRIGDNIASDHVTIIDDSTIEGSFGFYLYDNEGTRSKRTTLIEKGRLKNYLHSRETASSLEMENTGNARAQGFDYQPVVRMSNTFVERGNFTTEELLEDVNQGVYLLGSRGGEVDPAKGVFQFSAEEGFLIEKGEITSSLKDVALSGETLKILNSIDAVGKDFGMHIGFCGKEGQSVPVGDGGAPVRTIAAVGGTR